MLNLPVPELISRIITLLIAFTIHEFSHAFIADRLGDPTPRDAGRLTLNPLKHLDIFGSLLLIIGGFGWAKPVPVNPYALQRRTPAGLMWVSLAGPMSNFLMAIIAAIPIRAGLVSVNTDMGTIFPSFGYFLYVFIIINLTLMLFNLIPLAPLDGDAIADYFFPPSMAKVLSIIRPYGAYILIVVALVGPQLGFNVLGMIMSGPLSNLYFLLVGA
jgi:Zn-dependent protease